MEADLRASPGEACQEVRRGRVSGVADVGLEGHPQNPHLGALKCAAAIVECFGDEVYDVTWHGEVDVAGSLDEAVDKVELERAPRQVVRVDRDAVATHARAQRELHEPERLGGGGVDNLPDVE